MGAYRKVDSRIWNDAKFSELSDDGKLLFFMLLSHPNLTSMGAMRSTPQGLAAELRWLPERLSEAFGEVLSKGMVEYDERACLIALPNFLKYNKPESPNVIKAWVGAMDLLPECGLKSRTIQRLKDLSEGMTEAFREAFWQAFAKAMPNQKQEQEQKKDISQDRTNLSEGTSGNDGQSQASPALKVVR